ncbi:hypothetical protein QJQ45_018084 [Haematococcus lacustris]|nr:hypothetical protein QJQ45_018084 [Haematococcus lacustris]
MGRAERGLRILLYSVSLLMELVVVRCASSAGNCTPIADAICLAQLGLTVSGLKIASSPASASQPTISYSALASGILNCVGAGESTLRPLRILSPEQNRYILPPATERWSAMSGIDVIVDYRSITELTGIILDTSSNGQRLYDGWILDPVVMVDIAQSGMLEPLDAYIAADASIDWPDFIRYFRQVSSVYNGTVTGVPLAGKASTLYYRKDVFAMANLSAPSTWDEFVTIARALNGSDFNADGVPDHSICWQIINCLEDTVVFSQLLTPMTQALGTKSGWLFDPETMDPLVNNEAMLQALSMYKELLGYTLPLPVESQCSLVHVPFLQGACAMTIKWDEQFKGIQLMDQLFSLPANPWHGRIGFAQLPGSTSVLNRATGERLLASPTMHPGCKTFIGAATLATLAGKLERCTVATCPYATQQRNQFTGQTELINTAPNFGLAGFSGVINALQPSSYKKATFQLFAFLSASNISFPLVIAISPVGPFLNMHTSTEPALLNAWKAAGYFPPDVEHFMQNMNATLANPNVALDIRITSGHLYRQTLSHGLAMLQRGGTAAEVMAWVTAGFAAQLAKDGGPSQVQAAYLAGLNTRLVPRSPAPPQAASPALSTSTSSPDLTVPIAVPTTVCSVVLIVACLAVLVRRSSFAARLFGKSIAPRLGSSVTLLGETNCSCLLSSKLCPSRMLVMALPIMKHQDTQHTEHHLYSVLPIALQETLSQDDMNAAVELHHSLVRKLLVQHHGYESATEGDAFILAFHTPSDALHWAQAFQQGLLHLAWPEQLLQLDAGAPVWAAPGTLALLLWVLMVVCRGLRVRVGLHSGVHEGSDALLNKTTGRMQYGGRPLAMAKAVGDVGQGGMVLLSQSAFEQLPVSKLASFGMLLNMGDYVFTKDESLPATPIYQAFGRGLEHRAAFLQGPLRASEQLQAGVLDAPLGDVSITFANLVGVGTLMAWDKTLASAALDLYHTHAISTLQAMPQLLHQLPGHGGQQPALLPAGTTDPGYLVELSGGLCLAAFLSPAAALLWALQLRADLLEAPWQEELLAHELCEEVAVAQAVDVQPELHPLRPRQEEEGVTPQPISKAASLRSEGTGPGPCKLLPVTAEVMSVLFRGPRLKVGVDVGRVHADINPVTARMTYRQGAAPGQGVRVAALSQAPGKRGRVMNRAARIADKAHSGSVWCSQAAWEGCSQACPELMTQLGVKGHSLGQFSLKGECWALALRLLAVWLPGCCMGPVGACVGQVLGTTSCPALAGHAAGRSKRCSTCPVEGFQSAGLVALRLLSLLSQGCWPFTDELTRVVRYSSTSTTLPRRWSVPLGLHTTLQQARSTASAPQPPLVPMVAAPKNTTNCLLGPNDTEDSLQGVVQMLMRPGESSGPDRMMNEDAMRKSAFRLSKTTLVGPGFGTFRTVRNTLAKRPAIVNCEHTLPSANAQSIVMSGAKPAAVSEVSFGVDVERGLHPATGREYAPNRPAIKGNPGPFGLLCFGMTTCMLMFVTTSWSPAGFIPVVMGYAMFFGGAGQLIAGILELIKGNTFAGTAFSSYGCFWMGWFLFNFFAVDKITPSVTAVAMTGDTLWCGLWGVLTFLFYIVTLRKNGCLQTIFLSLWITFFLLAGGNYSDKCKEAAGYVGFFCGSSAIYAAIAMLYQDELGWTLPGMRPTNFI